MNGDEEACRIKFWVFQSENLYSNYLVECVVKKTRTMEASIVVIAFQKRVPVNLKDSIFIINPIYISGEDVGGGGGIGNQISPYPTKTHTLKKIDENADNLF